MANAPVPQILPFDSWKESLREDCEQQGKLVAFDAIGDPALRLLWRTGIEPSVKAIIDFAPSSPV